MSSKAKQVHAGGEVKSAVPSPAISKPGSTTHGRQTPLHLSPIAADENAGGVRALLCAKAIRVRQRADRLCVRKRTRLPAARLLRLQEGRQRRRAQPVQAALPRGISPHATRLAERSR